LTRPSLIAVLVALALGGCGGSNKPAMPVDPVMERYADAGRAALALERPEQAIAQYRDALARAHERDDAAAIGDLGFNLTVAQLLAGQPDAALKTVRESEAELARRGVAPVAALQLVEAVALYRSGQPAQADALAARVEAASDRDAAVRAAFLRGLVADDAGNTAGLRAALSRMTGARGAEAEADMAELSARVALRDGDAARAREEAEHAAALRRDLLDYRSLARCLALAAQAASRAGDTGAAAQLYLRAGRSASVQGDKPAAMRWLNQALGLSRDPQLTQTARAALAALGRSN
jgi:tetratricopeptide (TPR) repeat protein